MSAETLDEREICAFHQRSLAWMTGEMKQVVEWTTGDFDQVPTQAKAHDPQAEATQGKEVAHMVLTFQLWADGPWWLRGQTCREMSIQVWQ